MAIYHATMKSFSRGNGDSSVAAAAYRAGFDLLDMSTGLGHNYSHRGGVDFHQMLAPKGAPEWCFDAQYFWNANEAAETRKNARVCREVEVSLPHQLDPHQRRSLALALGQLLVNRFKVAVLVAVHTPSKYGDQRNHHVHLLMSARQVGPGGLGERACAEFDARRGGGDPPLITVPFESREFDLLRRLGIRLGPAISGEFLRGFPCQCTVGLLLVIEAPPRFDFAPRVGQ